ncbi:MAG TPA: hypothetical protein VI669_12555 [Vicinamibacteria bacterium]
MQRVSVEQWVDMFRAVGLRDEDMQRWHQEFERRHPESHQGFLEWLGLPAERISQIRQDSGKA